MVFEYNIWRFQKSGFLKTSLLKKKRRVGILVGSPCISYKSAPFSPTYIYINLKFNLCRAYNVAPHSLRLSVYFVCTHTSITYIYIVMCIIPCHVIIVSIARNSYTVAELHRCIVRLSGEYRFIYTKYYNKSIRVYTRALFDSLPNSIDTIFDFSIHVNR